MFSFRGRKKTVDVAPYIRRLCDITTPNRSTDSEERYENRYNRTIPILLAPWENDQPVVDDCTFGLTNDLADRGIGITLTQPFRSENVVVGFWFASDDTPDPWFFLGDIRRNQSIGGGFWQLGIELTELASSEYTDQLRPLYSLARG